MNKEMSLEEITHIFEVIGHGTNGIVYDATSLHVIRVSFNELDGGRCIPHIPEAVRERLSLPRILRYWYDEDTDYQITIIEKLNRLPYSIWGNNPVNLELFNAYRRLPDLDRVMKDDNPRKMVVTTARMVLEDDTLSTEGFVNYNYIIAPSSAVYNQLANLEWVPATFTKTGTYQFNFNSDVYYDIKKLEALNKLLGNRLDEKEMAI